MPVRSGWPSGVRGSGVFFICAAVSAPAAMHAAATASTCRFIVDPPLGRRASFAAERLLAPLPVHQLLDELDALEVHQLRVLLEAAVERHADLPRLRERPPILHR